LCRLSGPGSSQWLHTLVEDSESTPKSLWRARFWRNFSHLPIPLSLLWQARILHGIQKVWNLAWRTTFRVAKPCFVAQLGERDRSILQVSNNEMPAVAHPAIAQGPHRSRFKRIAGHAHQSSGVVVLNKPALADTPAQNKVNHSPKRHASSSFGGPNRRALPGRSITVPVPVPVPRSCFESGLATTSDAKNSIDWSCPGFLVNPFPVVRYRASS
jgi:hypothetical protein